MYVDIWLKRDVCTFAGDRLSDWRMYWNAVKCEQWFREHDLAGFNFSTTLMRTIPHCHYTKCQYLDVVLVSSINKKESLSLLWSNILIVGFLFQYGFWLCFLSLLMG